MKFSRKNLGRVATTLLATAMLTAFTAVPASAIDTDGTQGDVNGTAINNLTFNSVLWLPDEVSVPDATFTYTLTGVDANGDTVNIGSNGANGTETVKGASGQTANSGDIKFDKDSTIDASTVSGIKTATEEVSISLTGLSFNEVGVYKFQLTQSLKEPTSDAKNDFGLSNATRTVYLYVARTSDSALTYAVTGAVMVNGGQYSEQTKSNGTLVNYYMLEGDPDTPTTTPTAKQTDIFVANNVSGVMGDRSEQFAYTITLKAPAGKNYNAVFEKKDSSSWGKDSAQSASKGTVTFNFNPDGSDPSMGTYTANITLAHNQAIHVYGLSNGEKYNVNEVKFNQNEYQSSINPASYTNNTDATFDGSTVSLTFTNNREAITPTGVVVSVAPYVLLVLVAAAAGFVFLRKRRED